MRRTSCLTAGVLLERRAVGLGEADQLRLEEHLADCPECARDAEILSRWRSLSAEQGSPLSARARERAVARALRSRTPSGPATAAVAVRRRPRAVAWGAAAALAIGFVAVVAARPDPAPASGATATLGPRAGQLLGGGVLLAGELAADGQRMAVGRCLPAGARLRSEGGAELALGQGRVTLGRDTAVAWDGATSTVRLVAGAVDVSVDGTAGRRFAVATDRFEAVAVGTRFTVTADGVEVTHGRVQVLDRASARVVTRLSAGERWAQPLPSALDSKSTAQSTPPAAAGSATPSAQALLARARSLLARGRVAAARASLHRALGAELSPELDAEARSLLAECSLVEGDDAEAARRYAEVARRHPASPAGESALFAAARAELDAGRVAPARTLLRSYLKRYPEGRFATEARARLAALASTGDGS